MSHQYGAPWHNQPPPPRSNTGLSVVWALVPLFTCGMGTPLIMAHAARRLRSPLHALAAVLYALGIGVFIVAISVYDDTDLMPGWLDAVTTIGLFGSWLGGMGHALIIRGSVFRQDPHNAQGPRNMPNYGVQSFNAPPPPVHAVPYPTAPTVASNVHPPAHRPVQHTVRPQPQPHLQHSQPSRPQPAPTQQQNPTKGWLGPYRLIGELGKGGQGTVHLALTPQGQKVAIKLLHQHLTGDQMVRERFLREVEATRKVATFSTARVLDVNITDDQAYIVSEFVDGISLEQLVRDQGPRNEDGLTRLALATAGALAAIHRAGVVHRDFKPANVLIGPDGPRVIDFGIARALNQVTATSGNIMGTPAYMSPEQLAGGNIGPETDVFSWAATMIFAASGRVAFGEDTIPAILNRVINQHPDLSALPQSLRPLASECLDKQPGNRPTAADIMLRIVQ
ncbi:protein kinase [Streptosporangium sp. NPDC000239]|uniref:serine/threonine-protein kinase n=1 Tax=unclassified Streptosporangium TaxID=2632669 RepID=UPI00332E80CA